MHLSRLLLTHFKNYQAREFGFSGLLNVITGPNGTGKTNILDAIHFLCNTKSAFASSDATSIQQGTAFFRLEGQFVEGQKKDKVECICQQIGGKEFLLNGKTPERLASYIGQFPVVLTSPYDTDLIREGSEIRRKFFDLVLSQSDNGYLESAMAYNRFLKQRNSLLKQMAESGRSNMALLSTYDEQMLPLAEMIFERRRKFVGLFAPLVVKQYHALADSSETPMITYLSEDNTLGFKERFLANHALDRAAQRTTLGPHTDDYEFTFNGMSVKKMGSQGQQKTFALSLRLAHFEYIHKYKGKKPILLLDDIFDRLDEKRIQRLAESVMANKFGQVFVTDANPKRVTHVFAGEHCLIQTS